MNEEQKVVIRDTEGTEIEVYFVEQTQLNGKMYYLFADEEDEAYVFSSASDPEDTDIVLDLIEDDAELEAVAKVFEELLEDVDIERE